MLAFRLRKAHDTYCKSFLGPEGHNINNIIQQFHICFHSGTGLFHTKLGQLGQRFIISFVCQYPFKMVKKIKCIIFGAQISLQNIVETSLNWVDFMLHKIFPYLILEPISLFHQIILATKYVFESHTFQAYHPKLPKILPHLHSHKHIFCHKGILNFKLSNNIFNHFMLNSN